MISARTMVYADLATRDPADLGGLPWVTDGRTSTMPK